MRRPKRALSSVLVVLMVIGLFPPRVGARGVSERGEPKRLHFHLDQGGFLDPDEEHHLHVFGRRHALHRHTHATLEPFRADSPGASSKPSHFADVHLPTDRVVMMYVTQRSDRGGSIAAAHGAHVDHGLSIPFIHIPNDARRHAIRTANVRGLAKTRAATDGGCAGDLNGDGAVTEAELNSFTPCDIAKTLLYHHPQLLNFDANKGATVMTHIESVPELPQLKVFIYNQGKHGWYTMQPIQNPDGTPFTHPDTGQPVFSYVVNANVRQAAAAALQSALKAVTNEPTLAGASYNVVDGTTAVGPGGVQDGPSPLGAVAGVRQTGTTFTLSNLGPQPGVSLSVARVIGPDVTINFTNYYIRHLTLYVQFYDDADNLVVPEHGWRSRLDFVDGPDRPRYENDTTKFLSLINPPATVLGIPVGGQSDNFTFTMPVNATYAKLLAGGLGSGGDRNPMVEEMGKALTITFELGIPSFLLMSAAGMGAMGDALRNLFTATAIISGVVKAYFTFTREKSDFDLGSTVSNAALILANILAGVGLQKIVNVLAGAITSSEAIAAIPFVGWIANAVNILSTAALLAQTTAEVSTSPWVYETKLQATHDIDVVISRDPKNFQFPATATHYEVRARFSENDVRTSGAVALPGTTVSAPITYRFTGVPSGGRVDVTVAFYSATDWLAGRGEQNGVRNLTVQDQEAQTIAITIQEQLVPLDGNSVYTHKQKLVAAGGVHRWQAAAAPTATLADLDVGVTGRGVSELGNISLNQTVGAAGYVWRSLSPDVPDCLSGGTGSQLYTYQNVSLTQNPETGLKFSKCGFSLKPYVLLDLLGPADGTGRNFVIEPAADGNWYARRFVLDGSGNFDVAVDQSYGRLPMAVDSAVLHPKGYILGVNRDTSKLFQLKLGPTAVHDANAPDALLFAGPATSLVSAEANPNLLFNPRAVALGSDGQIIVLEDISILPAGTAPAGVRGRLRAFSEFGNPIKYFGGRYGALLTAEPTPVTYLDMGIENKGYIYVLSYAHEGHFTTDYRMDIYNPNGTFLVRTTGVAAARLAVDLWRNINTLNFETLTGPAGRLEPSISEWVPPTPPASDSKVRRTSDSKIRRTR